MKITKLKIKELFGLDAFEYDGKDIELTGKKGAGKTAVLSAIRYILENKSEREYILKEGSKEGEGILETDTGLLVHRKKRTSKSDYKVIKEKGVKAPRTEAFLRDIFTPLQLNPVEFTTMTKEEQNRIVLDLIDFSWDLAWIREQFGEVVPGVNYEQNILNVLYEIQSEDGYYFLTRHDLNLKAREKTAIITEIGGALPKDYNAKAWEKAEVGEVYRKIERISRDNRDIEKAQEAIKNRDNKIRSFEAEKEINLASIEKETTSERSRQREIIEEAKRAIKEAEKELSRLEERKMERIKVEESVFKTNVSEFEAEVKQYEGLAGKKKTSTSDLQEEARHIEDMKKFINEYNRMVRLREEVEAHRKESKALTAKIELARTLPGMILETSNIPISGLSVKDGVALINGLPISNLSSGEKLELCIKIATQNKGKLELLLIDGTEKLPSADRAKMYRALKRSGVQFIATRTTDEEVLNVTEL